MRTDSLNKPNNVRDEHLINLSVCDHVDVAVVNYGTYVAILTLIV